MTPRVARALAIPFGLLAMAMHLLVTFWVQPLTWRIGPGPAMFAIVAAVAASALGPMLLYRGVVRSFCRRPAALRVDPERRLFVAAGSPRVAGLAAIVIMWIGAGLVLTERVPDSYRMRLFRSTGAVPVSVAAVAVAVVLAMVVLYRGGPSVLLAPTGLTVMYRPGRKRREARWEELAAGGPPPPAKRTARSVRLAYRYAGHGRVPSRIEELPIGLLHVDPVFLMAAVRHYVENPDRRAAIGTEAELARLSQSVRLAEAGPGVSERIGVTPR